VDELLNTFISLFGDSDEEVEEAPTSKENEEGPGLKWKFWGNSDEDEDGEGTSADIDSSEACYCETSEDPVDDVKIIAAVREKGRRMAAFGADVLEGFCPFDAFDGPHAPPV